MINIFIKTFWSLLSVWSLENAGVIYILKFVNSFRRYFNNARSITEYDDGGGGRFNIYNIDNPCRYFLPLHSTQVSNIVHWKLPLIRRVPSRQRILALTPVMNFHHRKTARRRIKCAEKFIIILSSIIIAGTNGEMSLVKSVFTRRRRFASPRQWWNLVFVIVGTARRWVA